MRNRLISLFAAHKTGGIGAIDFGVGGLFEGS